MKLHLVFGLSLSAMVLAAPIEVADDNAPSEAAVLNSRFGAYEFDQRKRDDAAVLNSRFGAYEFDDKKRDENAVLNSRFGAYEFDDKKTAKSLE